jgi:peptide/nickel transport system permease protein
MATRTDMYSALMLKRPAAFEHLQNSIVVFFRALRRNRAGMVGFIGLVIYALWVLVLPRFVPFDDEVRLDQIAAPPGSRLVMVTRAEDASQYKSLNDLAGKIVGVIDNSSGEAMVESYEDQGIFEVETARWRNGNGIPDALEDLAEGKVDAVVLFSDGVMKYMTENQDAAQREEFAGLTVSNPELGAPHLLGTDTQGRDIFSHIANGGTTLITTALSAGLLSTLIAVSLGALAALLGGVIDTVITAMANLVLTIPSFPLLVVLAALIRLDNALLLALLIALLSWPILMRTVRAQVLSLRERDYVQAAFALDLGLPHIILREILPNMMSFVAINFIFAVTKAMYDQVGLIFLGMVPINDYTWGVMLYFGRTRGTLFSPDSASMVLSPVLAIALFQVSMVLFARALEEMFDPRLRTVQ